VDVILPSAQPDRVAESNAQYLWPMSTVVSLFFLWAIGVHFNDILIPHFKRVFQLNDFQSSFIQAAFFGGYFIAAYPAGRITERIGYKRGIVTGLSICAIGALMFIPSAYVRFYPLFLGSLFIMASGQSFLEVASNPYIALLGPPKQAAMRLNIAQAFNALGAVLTPTIGTLLILRPAERASAFGSPSSEMRILALPYLGFATIYGLYALLISKSHLPEVQPPGAVNTPSQAPRFSEAFRYPHLIKGVVAQFFYVGAQVGVASFVIRLSEHQIPGLPDSIAAQYLRYHLIGFMLGRIFGSVMLHRTSAARLLAVFALAALIASALVVFGTNTLPIWACISLGGCNSIMFPTIFALSLNGIGNLTKMGSSLLVMAIVGGALLPPLMGLISDASNIQWGFLVPMVAYALVLHFAVTGRRHVIRGSEIS
jgi:MFS transporter, FHS family, L-fucose permease